MRRRYPTDRKQLPGTENPSARGRVHPPFQVRGPGPAGNLPTPDRLSGPVLPAGRSRRPRRPGPRPAFLHRGRARGPHRGHQPSRRHPRTLDQARALAIDDLLADPLPPRRARQYERIRKAPKSNYPIKKHRHVRVASRVTYKIKVIPKSPSPAQKA